MAGSASGVAEVRARRRPRKRVRSVRRVGIRGVAWGEWGGGGEREGRRRATARGSDLTDARETPPDNNDGEFSLDL